MKKKVVVKKKSNHNRTSETKTSKNFSSEIIGIALLLALSLFGNVAHAVFYNSTFQSCTPFNVSTGEDIKNITLKIILNQNNINYSNFNAGGTDIRITNSSNCNFNPGDVEVQQYIFNWTVNSNSTIYIRTTSDGRKDFSIWHKSPSTTLKQNNNTFLIFDDFERPDSTSLGDAGTGQSWQTIASDRCFITDHALSVVGTGDGTFTCYLQNLFESTNVIVWESQSKINESISEFKYHGLQSGGVQLGVISYGIGGTDEIAGYSDSGFTGFVTEGFVPNRYANFSARYNISSNSVSYFYNNSRLENQSTFFSRFGADVDLWSVTNGGGGSNDRNLTFDNLRVYASTYGDNKFFFSAQQAFVNATNPTVTIIEPANATQSSQIYNLTYTVTAGTNPISQCVYSIDGASNISLPTCANVTGLNASTGSHSITVCANDTLNGIGCATRGFTVSGPTQFFNLVNLPVTNSSVYIDLDTGDVRFTNNASMDLNYNSQVFDTWRTVNGASANHFYGNNTIDLTRAVLINSTSNRSSPYGNQALAGTGSNSQFQAVNIYGARTTSGRFALFNTSIGGNLLNISWELSSSLNFSNTVLSNFSGSYSYLGTLWAGLDLQYGYAYIGFPTGTVVNPFNYTDSYTFFAGNAFITSSNRTGNPNPSKLVRLNNTPFESNACFNTTQTFASFPYPSTGLGAIPSTALFCVRSPVGNFKLQYFNDTGIPANGLGARSACVLPGDTFGKFELNNTPSVYFSFLTQNATTNAVGDYDFVYVQNTNIILTGPNSSSAFYGREYVSGASRNTRPTDTSVLPSFNSVSCSVLGDNYAVFGYGDIDTPPVPGVPEPYPQDTFCFNLTASFGTCGGNNQVYGVIRVLRTGTYCETFACILSPQVFDFYWRIYTDSSAFSFGQTAFIPADPQTATSALALLWNTSAPSSTQMTYYITFPSGSSTANITIGKNETNIRIGHNLTITAQNGLYFYWLQANTTFGFFESEKRNFTIGPSFTPGVPNPNNPTTGLEQSGFCSGESCAWILGFFIWLIVIGLCWWLGGQKNGLKFGLVGAITMGVLLGTYNALPFFILVPMLVLAIVVVVKLLADTIGGKGGS